MSRARHETLDEVIDRVAADLTCVPADPGFTARALGKASAPAVRLPLWVGGIAAAATVVIGIGLSVAGRPSEAPQIAASMPLAAESTTAKAISAPAEAQAAGVPEATRSIRVFAPARLRAGLNDDAAMEGQAIPALAAPPQLTVTDLRFEPLDIPAVALDRLEVTSIALTEINLGGESKE